MWVSFSLGLVTDLLMLSGVSSRSWTTRLILLGIELLAIRNCSSAMRNDPPVTGLWEIGAGVGFVDRRGRWLHTLRSRDAASPSRATHEEQNRSRVSLMYGSSQCSSSVKTDDKSCLQLVFEHSARPPWSSSSKKVWANASLQSSWARSCCCVVFETWPTVPWLQSSRSWLTRLSTFRNVVPTIVPCAESSWCRAPSLNFWYWYHSTALKSVYVVSSNLAGKSMVSFGLLRERQLTRVLSFATEVWSDLAFHFSVTSELKMFRLSNGDAPRNLNKLNKSSRRFWIGVPVTAHLRSAWRAQIDFANVLDGSRIICAANVSDPPCGAVHVTHPHLVQLLPIPYCGAWEFLSTGQDFLSSQCEQSSRSWSSRWTPSAFRGISSGPCHSKRSIWRPSSDEDVWNPSI